MKYRWGAGINEDHMDRVDAMQAAADRSLDLDEIELNNAARDLLDSQKAQACADAFKTLAEIDMECWRCGSEGREFQKPSHPDGGGTICDPCYRLIYHDPLRW